MKSRADDAMKHVGVREFRDHATQYLAGDEVLAIERHGVPLGYYWPARLGSESEMVPREVREARERVRLTMPPKGSKEAKEARQRLERTLQKVCEETGLTEDELADLFDLSKPLP